MAPMINGIHGRIPWRVHGNENPTYSLKPERTLKTGVFAAAVIGNPFAE